MPNSPRQLIQRGKVEEARREFIKIQSDLNPHEIAEEFGLMRSQIECEQERRIPPCGEIFKQYTAMARSLCLYKKPIKGALGVRYMAHFRGIIASTIRGSGRRNAEVRTKHNSRPFPMVFSYPAHALSSLPLCLLGSCMRRPVWVYFLNQP